MKVYVQNGFNKRVFNAPNYTMAVKGFLKSLITKTKDGDELADLGVITWASNCGYIDDMEKMEMFDEMDDVQCFPTFSIMEKLGRKDISKFLKEGVKKAPKEVKALLNAFKNR